MKHWFWLQRQICIMKLQAWAQETITDCAKIIEALIKILTLQLYEPKGKIWEFGFKLGMFLTRGIWCFGKQDWYKADEKS